MKTILYPLILISFQLLKAQDSIRHRVIFIGDAGEINSTQQKVISEATHYIIKDKTTAIFLGDNIYPRGLGLPNSPEELETKKILQSQYVPLRNQGVPVYFIPGNHDWDKSGKQGLEKIKLQSAFLNQQQDSLLKLIPTNGCPDPSVIPLSEHLIIIAFDSEWWLHPFEKDNPDSVCTCHTQKEIIEKLNELFYANKDKMILLTSHHPFQSYGSHGGYFSWKDHLFPLTAANKNLYIPLPIIGSLYPILRNTFVNPQDIRHPLYQDMIKQIDEVFAGFPNMVHVAGHEHSLQLIQNKQLQVVSGAGAKKTFVKKGEDALFGKETNGIVTADELINKAVRFTFYELKNNTLQIAFTFTKPYQNIQTTEANILYNTANEKDSVFVQANEGFDKVGKFYRQLFGENYRKEWATKTKLPLIRISSFKGGLTPTQRGGGQQSLSLRLKDKNGNEWVMRSVNKYPDVVLPQQLRETFAKDVLRDAMSAQHPYSALIVPVIADAVGVPHTNPIIGLVASDTALGMFQKDFVNTVCLLEEREPTGKSDNTDKLLKELKKDNDNNFDSVLFLKARLLDLLIGDWDRHEDQWRWVPEKNEKGKRYTPIPRDRDQVFHVIDGLLPKIATLPWLEPKLHDFNSHFKRLNTFFTNGAPLNARFLNQFSYEEWMRITKEFVAKVTDDVLEKALKRLPIESYILRHHQLLEQLKKRRDNMPQAMAAYYRFLNKIIDIQTSNKNELIEIRDAPNKGLQVSIYKISKEGETKNQLFNKVFSPEITREIRLYTEGGDDSVVVNNHSNIKLRIVGGKGEKAYNMLASAKKVHLYEQNNTGQFIGNKSMFKRYISNDSSHTAYVTTNPYNKIIPFLNIGYNADDGLKLGGSLTFINQGFRKMPFGNMQQISFSRALSSNAYSFIYKGEWLNALNKADFVVQAKALAPSNSQNFFGVGNQTAFDQTKKFAEFYRTRFNLYRIDPSVRWRNSGKMTMSLGSSFEYYQYKKTDNTDIIINYPSLIHSYDSSTIYNSKAFGGVVLNLNYDNRDNVLLPTSGSFFNIKTQAYKGLNSFSESFAQIISELAIYKKLDRQSYVVIANRLGGGLTLGKPTFYQSLFLGGHENLLGFRQYRFAGERMLYNNFEIRIKMANISSYILPGQLGIMGFYDVGKVWAKGYNSDNWHQGLGSGIYFAPAQMAVFQLVAGYSKEGWYPYFTMGLRF